MYLNVTTLAEMTDHMGMTILPQALTSYPHSSPPGLQEISTSTLTWPQIHCPSSASWRFWTKTVCNQFTGSATGIKLAHPLGAWLPTYQQHRTWHWRLALTGRLLNQSPTMQNPRAAIPICSQHTQTTFSPMIPTNQMFQGPPVTPTDKFHQVIKLPVPHLPPCTEPLAPISPHWSLITQFWTTLGSWQRPLFGPIMQCQPTCMLCDLNQDHQPILLVSDASVQKINKAALLGSSHTMKLHYGKALAWLQVI